MAAKKIQKTNLEDFCIDGLFLFIEKSNHLNSQVAGETAEFWLQTERFFKTEPSFRYELQTADQLYNLQILYTGHFFPRLQTFLWFPPGVSG